MSMNMEIKIDSNRLPDIKAQTTKNIEVALEAVGIQMESNALDEVDNAVYSTPESPSYVRTGNLRNSITHTVDGKSAVVGSAIEYAPFVELGTSRMKGRPFIKPALEKNIDEYVDILNEYLSKNL